MSRSKLRPLQLSDGEEGLRYALCALSFFRHRWDKVPRFKNASRRRNQEKKVSCYGEYVRVTRDYVRRAREAGWRGSVIEAVLKKGESNGGK